MFPPQALQSLKKKAVTGLVASTLVIGTAAAVAPPLASAELARPAYGWTMASQPTPAVFSPSIEAPEVQEVRLFQRGRRLKKFGKFMGTKVVRPLVKESLRTFACGRYGVCRY